MNIEQTIAAISTPSGYGGICIVRISGSDAFPICSRIFRRPENKSFDMQKPGTICYGHIVNQDGVIDEVLVTKLAAPATYTREDIAEINCHGGMTAAKSVLQAVIENGARLAEPGEFTKRAFLSGRIDLSQAEAVSDIITAKTELSGKAAAAQLEGRLSEVISAVKSEIISLLAHLEVTIQYPEYDTEDITAAELSERLTSVRKSIEKILSTFRMGDILREGYKAVIAGKPNVGKSMLLNALIGKDKSIVTEIPGTTRDIVDEYVNLNGIPVKLYDTAGIRDTSDYVESIGVKRSVAALEQADIVLLVIDASRELDEQDLSLIEKTEGLNRIFILNKSDLEQNRSAADFFSDKEHILISAFTAANIDSLIDRLFSAASLNLQTEEAVISNARHRDCLQAALKAAEEASAAADSEIPVDFIETDIRDCLFHLGRITGETADEDIINEIFSKFCLGK